MPLPYLTFRAALPFSVGLSLNAPRSERWIAERSTTLIAWPLLTFFWVVLFCGAAANFAIADQSVNAEEVKADVPAQAESFLNLRYSSHTGRAGQCDVYIPAGTAPPQGYATIIVIHGGAWMSGSKWLIQSYSRFLAQHGYAAVSINYRLAPGHRFPAQVDDVREAALWVKQNAERFHFDIDRLGLFGYSAGGHLSLLVSALQDESSETQLAASQWSAADPRWKQMPKFRATCAGGPPCDFRELPLDNTTLAFFLGGSRRDCPAAYEAASPINHVSKQDPAVHIIHGVADSLVPIQTSVAFKKAMLEAGASCELTRLADQGHAMTFLNPKTSAVMREFFDRTLTARTTPQ